MQDYALRLLQEVDAIPSGENHAVYDCNGLHIHLHYDERSDTLLLYVHLGFLPEHPARQTYEYMLELNFLGADLGGGHVGLHGRSRALVYSLRLEVAQQDALSLRNALHLFAGHALEMLEVKRRGRVAASGDGERLKKSAAQDSAETPTNPVPAPTTDRGVMWG